jgi:uncharacterized membrane protein (DUF485 family)
MSSVIYDRIRRNPKFDQLVQKRGSFAWTLSAIVLVIFYGFFLLVAFNPKLLGQPIAEGSMWAIGYTAEMVMFVFFWILTFLYVRRANGEFDELTAEIIKDAQKETK